MRDPEVERAERATSSTSLPAPPIRPEELTKSGKQLTKKEKKEVIYIVVPFLQTQVNIVVIVEKQNCRTWLV